MENTENKGIKSTKKKVVIGVSLLALVLALTLLLISLLSGHSALQVQPVKTFVFNGDAFTSDGVTDLPDSLKTVKVTADGSSSRIISTSSSFEIETAGECDSETLTKYIRISPETPMAVTKLSDKKFRVEPAKNGFIPGTVYNVTVGDPENPSVSYAFQTENNLIVRSTVPGDGKSGVYTDTGIEFTFSDAVKTSDIGDYFTITPSADGKFIYYPDGRTIAFVPDKELSPETVYTVTLKSGIVGISGKKTENDTVIAFRTANGKEGDSNVSYSLDLTNDLSYVCYPGESLSLVANAYGVSRFTAYPDCDFVIYRFNSSESAEKSILSLVSGESGDCSKSGVTLCKKISAAKDGGGSVITTYRGEYTFTEEGVYYIELRRHSDNKLLDYGFAQASVLRCYSVSGDGKTLLYINSRQALDENCTINGTLMTVHSFMYADRADFSAVTATVNNGIAEFDNKDSNAALVTIKSGSDYLLKFPGLSKSDPDTYYMKHIYTDREVYFSNDSVNFSGFITPAYSGGKVPDELYLTTGLSSSKTKIEIGENGYFSGTLKVSDMSASYLTLKLTDSEGNVYVSKGIRITEEEKPLIKAEITLDKYAYSRGEDVTATLTASFYDGTPAPGFEFSFICNRFQSDFTTVTTDENGKAVFSFKCGKSEILYSTDPLLLSVNAELSGFETQKLTASASFFYFGSDYIYSATRNESEVVCTLYYRNFKALSGMSLEELYRSDIDKISRGAAADGKVFCTLNKYTTSSYIETLYDTQAKRSYTVKRYKVDKEVLKTVTVEFVNGEFTLPLCKGAENENFEYSLEFKELNSTYEYFINAKESNGYYQWNSTSYESTHPELKLNSDKYTVGDKVLANLTVGGSQIDCEALYVLCANGIKSYSLSNEFSTKYDNEMIPGSVLHAVVFNPETGGYNHYQKALSFDWESAAKGEITLSSDKSVYLPGEIASVTVRGIKNGVAIVSVVDESCFALGEQKIDVSEFFSSIGKANTTTGNYYDYYYYGYYRLSGIKAVLFNATAYYSDITRYDGTIDIEESDNKGEILPPADTGSNGNSTLYYIRSYFADNPEFSVVMLDSNGEGTITFKVPDNMTTWRISCVATTGIGGDISDIKIGSGISSVICTKDFYTNISSCGEYLVGDDISLSARSYGNAAKGEIIYKAELYDGSGKLIKTLMSSAENHGYAWFNFKNLEEGEYSVIVYANCGDKNDAVRTVFSVIKSNRSIYVTENVKPGDISTLSPLAYPLTLTFYGNSADYRLYFDLINNISSRNNGRSDDLAAKYMAVLAYAKLCGGARDEETERIKNEFRSYVGEFVSLLSYSSEDSVLTANIISVCPDIFTENQKSELIAAYNDIISRESISDDVTLCSSLMALASLKEPVLDNLYTVKAQSSSYSYEAKLYLVSAFAAIGDFSEASAIYKAVRNGIATEDKEHNILYFGKDYDYRSTISGIAMLSAARISKTDALMLANYLSEQNSDYDNNSLALACYLRFFTPSENAEDKELVYTVSGERKSVTVSPWGSFTLRLTKDELSTFTVEKSEGLSITAGYRKSVEELTAEGTASKRLTIEKKFEYYKDNMYKVTLKLSGRTNMVYESFDISDTIPSGARFFSLCTSSYGYQNSGNIRSGMWVNNHSGQRITGYVFVYNKGYSDIKNNVCPEYSFSVEVSYIIRGAVTGEFVADSALVYNGLGNTFALSDSYTVTIKDGEEWNIVKK